MNENVRAIRLVRMARPWEECGFVAGNVNSGSGSFFVLIIFFPDRNAGVRACLKIFWEKF